MTKLEEIIKQHAEGINRTTEEFLEAVRKSNLAYDDTGKLCNIVDGKLLPVESQTGALSIVYHRIKEEVKSASRTIASGIADVHDSDDPTQMIRKVVVAEPTADERVAVPVAPSEAQPPKLSNVGYFNNLILEFNQERGELETALATGGFYVRERGYIEKGSDGVEIPAPESKVRDFLWTYYTTPASKRADAEDNLVDISDEVTLEPDPGVKPEENLDDSYQKKEKLFSPMARAHGISIEEVEKGLLEQRCGFDLIAGTFHEIPLEPNGELRGREVSYLEANDRLGEYVVKYGERLLPQAQETPAEVPVAPTPPPDVARSTSPHATIPEMSSVLPPVPAQPVDGFHNHEIEEWMGEGDKPHAPADEGLEELVKEAFVKPESGVKLPRRSYLALSVGGLLVAGGLVVAGYIVRGVVGESVPTVAQRVADRETIEDLNKQLSEVKADLNQAYADNDDLNDTNYIETRGHDICIGEQGVLGAELEQKTAGYAALERQLTEAPKAEAPDAPEVLALIAQNSALEMAREQDSIKAQEAENKYGECASAKDVCESSRKTELETCNGYAANLGVVRAERDDLTADIYGLTFDLEDCLITEGTPIIEYKDKLVEKIVEKECPAVECPQVAPECPAVDMELSGKYDICMIEKNVAIQTIEDAGAAYADCEANKEIVQSTYDGCVGELGQAREALGKKKIDSANAALQASRELGETKEQLAQAQKGTEQCKREYQTLEARTAGSNYERIKANPAEVMAVAEDYVRRAGGTVKVKGHSCDEALKNFSGLITGNISDANIERVVIEKMRGICGKIDPEKGYIQIKVKN